MPARLDGSGSANGSSSRCGRDMALAWPSAYPGITTQRWGPVLLANEPAGYADAQKADSSTFPGAAYGAHVHRGLDIRAYEGTNLYAAEAGTIVKATTFNNGELYMQLRINPTTVLQYDHCSAFVAKVGDVVQRGQLIAKAGHTGNALAAHLHFEVQITEGGRVFRYDPALFLAGGALADDPRIKPPGAVDVPLNAYTQDPPALVDVAPTNLYADEDCTVIAKANWPGFSPVGCYSGAMTPATKSRPIRYSPSPGVWEQVYAPIGATSNWRLDPRFGSSDTTAAYNAGVDAAAEAAKKAKK